MIDVVRQKGTLKNMLARVLGPGSRSLDLIVVVGEAPAPYVGLNPESDPSFFFFPFFFSNWEPFLLGFSRFPPLASITGPTLASGCYGA